MYLNQRPVDDLCYQQADIKAEVKCRTIEFRENELKNVVVIMYVSV